MAKTLTELAAEIISAMATNTSMTLDELEHNLSQVFASLKRISEQEIAAAPAPEPKTGGRSKRGSRVTVTDPSASIREDRVICLECHKQFRHLTHTHLRSHDLTPASYRKKYGIPEKQPLMADTVRLKKHYKAAKSSTPRSEQNTEAKVV